MSFSYIKIRNSLLLCLDTGDDWKVGGKTSRSNSTKYILEAEI